MFAQGVEAIYTDDDAAGASAVHGTKLRNSILLLEKGRGWDVFNAESTTVTNRQLTEAMGDVAGLPARCAFRRGDWSIWQVCDSVLVDRE